MKLKFPEDFWHYHSQASEMGKNLTKEINDVKKKLKSVKKGECGFFTISGGDYAVIGTVCESGQKAIYVTCNYWEVTNEPECGWMTPND